MEDFIFSNNWFSQKYEGLSSSRFPTFKAALNLYVQSQGKIIVETGTTRFENDWGAGMSTLLFAEVVKVFGFKLYTVDISEDNINICKYITREFSSYINYVVDDSINFLENFDGRIDLLYLDSLDYPLTEEEGPVEACQEHQLKEYLAAKNKLGKKSIILLDDNQLPGGGKCKLTKLELLKDGWRNVIDSQQSLWIR